MTCATLPPVAAGDDELVELRRMAKLRLRATENEYDVIVAALRKGKRQADVARAIGRSREHVRKVYDAWRAENPED